MVVNVNEENIQEVLSNKKITLLDFWAEWCGPCKTLNPIIKSLGEQENNDVNICKINVDENSDLASSYKVRGIPTMILFSNGNEVKRFVGVKSKEELEIEINNLL